MKPEGLNERGNMVQPQPRQWEVPTRPWPLETLGSTPSLWGLLSILTVTAGPGRLQSSA